MTKPSKQELIQFIKNNNITSYKPLAEKYNVANSTISSWLQSYSIKLSDFQEKINKPSKQKLIQFIIDNNGSSYNQLMSKYNITESKIAYWLRSYSIKLHDFQKKIQSKPSKQELIKFIKNNNITSYNQLLSKYDVTKPTIVYWCKSYSIKISDFQEKINKPSKKELIQFIKDNNVTSYKQLLSKYDAKKTEIAYWLKSYSIKLSDFQEKINKPSKQELIQFINDNNGSSCNQLMSKYNITKSQISYWLSSYSIKLSDFQENKPSKQELIQLIKDNNVTSYKPLADHYNVAKSVINYWLTSYSIRLSDFQEKTNKPSKQKLIQFIKDNNGSSYKQLSKKYNVKTSIIGNWLTSYSIKLSDFQEKINKPPKQELIKFIKNNNGLSYKQVAEHYNITTSTIYKWLKSYSIKLSDFKNETIFYHNDNFLNLSDKPNKNHISIKDLDYDKVVLLIKGENPVVYVEKDGKGKTTTPKALIEEYIRKEKLK